MHDGRPLMRILYVDDEADIRHVVSIALRDIGGLAVKVCETGREALDQGPEFRPDLVLLDVMMPEMDGPAMLEAMRNVPELADVPVVFMSARVQAHEVADYRRLGAVAVIVKPFDPMALAEDLREIWRKRHERAEA